MKSFISVDPSSHFPIENLPFGVGVPRGSDRARVYSRIGDWAVDLYQLQCEGRFAAVAGLPEGVFGVGRLNAFMALGRPVWRAVRDALTDLLQDDNPILRDDRALRERVLVPADRVAMMLPAEIGDYTDFYSSKEHATNVGTMFRGPENALMPNWLHLPVAYHGRASSVVVSGTDLHRPMGQTKADDADAPTYGPSKLMDFELETAFLVGSGTDLGETISVADAEEHIFGMVLMNDWSARDIQKWEYVPLGPFLGKNFGTSISPWVVTLDALAPFRCPGPDQDPEPLPYLRGDAPGAFDVVLEVTLAPEGRPPVLICESNFRTMYWTMAQQLAHHTVNGCPVNAGDLMGSGTLSGPTEGSYGSMLELSWRGTKPIALPGGGERKFIADGDTIAMTGYAQGDGYRVGFGEVTGTILPAKG
ncbi:MAG: fumarylacetoacetase [Planctomycetota bacterium]